MSSPSSGDATEVVSQGEYVRLTTDDVDYVLENHESPGV